MAKIAAALVILGSVVEEVFPIRLVKCDGGWIGKRDKSNLEPFDELYISKNGSSELRQVAQYVGGRRGAVLNRIPLAWGSKGDCLFTDFNKSTPYTARAIVFVSDDFKVAQLRAEELIRNKKGTKFGES